MFSSRHIQLYQRRHGTTELVLPSEYGERRGGEGVGGITQGMEIIMILTSKLGKGACGIGKGAGLMDWRSGKIGVLLELCY